jgi:hypothetical protein
MGREPGSSDTSPGPRNADDTDDRFFPFPLRRGYCPCISSVNPFDQAAPSFRVTVVAG